MKSAAVSHQTHSPGVIKIPCYAVPTGAQGGAPALALYGGVCHIDGQSVHSAHAGNSLLWSRTLPGGAQEKGRATLSHYGLLAEGAVDQGSGAVAFAAGARLSYDLAAAQNDACPPMRLTLGAYPGESGARLFAELSYDSGDGDYIDAITAEPDAPASSFSLRVDEKGRLNVKLDLLPLHYSGSTLPEGFPAEVNLLLSADYAKVEKGAATLMTATDVPGFGAVAVRGAQSVALRGAQRPSETTATLRRNLKSFRRNAEKSAALKRELVMLQAGAANTALAGYDKSVDKLFSLPEPSGLSEDGQNLRGQDIIHTDMSMYLRMCAIYLTADEGTDDCKFSAVFGVSKQAALDHVNTLSVLDGQDYPGVRDEIRAALADAEIIAYLESYAKAFVASALTQSQDKDVLAVFREVPDAGGRLDYFIQDTSAGHQNALQKMPGCEKLHSALLKYAYAKRVPHLMAYIDAQKNGEDWAGKLFDYAARNMSLILAGAEDGVAPKTNHICQILDYLDPSERVTEYEDPQNPGAKLKIALAPQLSAIALDQMLTRAAAHPQLNFDQQLHTVMCYGIPLAVTDQIFKQAVASGQSQVSEEKLKLTFGDALEDIRTLGHTVAQEQALLYFAQIYRLTMATGDLFAASSAFRTAATKTGTLLKGASYVGACLAVFQTALMSIMLADWNNLNDSQKALSILGCAQGVLGTLGGIRRAVNFGRLLSFYEPGFDPQAAIRAARELCVGGSRVALIESLAHSVEGDRAFPLYIRNRGGRLFTAVSTVLHDRGGNVNIFENTLTATPEEFEYPIGGGQSKFIGRQMPQVIQAQEILEGDDGYWYIDGHATGSEVEYEAEAPVDMQPGRDGFWYHEGKKTDYAVVWHEPVARDGFWWIVTEEGGPLKKTPYRVVTDPFAVDEPRPSADRRFWIINGSLTDIPYHEGDVMTRDGGTYGLFGVPLGEGETITVGDPDGMRVYTFDGEISDIHVRPELRRTIVRCRQIGADDEGHPEFVEDPNGPLSHWKIGEQVTRYSGDTKIGRANGHWYVDGRDTGLLEQDVTLRRTGKQIVMDELRFGAELDRPPQPGDRITKSEPCTMIDDQWVPVPKSQRELLKPTGGRWSAPGRGEGWYFLDDGQPWNEADELPEGRRWLTAEDGVTAYVGSDRNLHIGEINLGVYVYDDGHVEGGEPRLRDAYWAYNGEPLMADGARISYSRQTQYLRDSDPMVVINGEPTRVRYLEGGTVRPFGQRWLLNGQPTGKSVALLNIDPPRVEFNEFWQWIIQGYHTPLKALPVRPRGLGGRRVFLFDPEHNTWFETNLDGKKAVASNKPTPGRAGRWVTRNTGVDGQMVETEKDITVRAREPVPGDPAFRVNPEKGQEGGANVWRFGEITVPRETSHEFPYAGDDGYIWIRSNPTNVRAGEVAFRFPMNRNPQEPINRLSTLRPQTAEEAGEYAPRWVLERRVMVPGQGERIVIETTDILYDPDVLPAPGSDGNVYIGGQRVASASKPALGVSELCYEPPERAPLAKRLPSRVGALHRDPAIVVKNRPYQQPGGRFWMIDGVETTIPVTEATGQPYFIPAKEPGQPNGNWFIAGRDTGIRAVTGDTFDTFRVGADGCWEMGGRKSYILSEPGQRAFVNADGFICLQNEGQERPLVTNFRADSARIEQRPIDFVRTAPLRLYVKHTMDIGYCWHLGDKTISLRYDPFNREHIPSYEVFREGGEPVLKLGGFHFNSKTQRDIEGGVYDLPPDGDVEPIAPPRLGSHVAREPEPEPEEEEAEIDFGRDGASSDRPLEPSDSGGEMGRPFDQGLSESVRPESISVSDAFSFDHGEIRFEGQDKPQAYQRSAERETEIQRMREIVPGGEMLEESQFDRPRLPDGRVQISATEASEAQNRESGAESIRGRYTCVNENTGELYCRVYDDRQSLHYKYSRAMRRVTITDLRTSNAEETHFIDIDLNTGEARRISRFGDEYRIDATEHVNVEEFRWLTEMDRLLPTPEDRVPSTRAENLFRLTEGLQSVINLAMSACMAWIIGKMIADEFKQLQKTNIGKVELAMDMMTEVCVAGSFFMGAAEMASKWLKMTEAFLNGMPIVSGIFGIGTALFMITSTIIKSIAGKSASPEAGLARHSLLAFVQALEQPPEAAQLPQ
jgi:hypothetical protein